MAYCDVDILNCNRGSCEYSRRGGQVEEFGGSLGGRWVKQQNNAKLDNRRNAAVRWSYYK